MSRRVWPLGFLLHTCPLSEAAGRVAEIVKLIFRDDNPQQFEVPVALRWATNPVLGFPREPFQVFRRPRRPLPPVNLHTPLTVNGTVTVSWGLEEMYEVNFQANPDPGSTLVFEAIGSNNAAIPGQRITLSSAAANKFKSPGIAHLRITGRGNVTNIIGVRQNDVANAPDWQRFEVVGLPFEAGEVSPPIYNPLPQGFEPPALSGAAAARLRLDIARALQLPIPPTGVADIPTPAWPAPATVAYLNRLRLPPSMMQLIRACLDNSDDANPSALQALYRFTQSVDGVSQLDIPGSSPDPANPTSASLPVVAITMLGVSSDSFAATGLGYGTIDFPPALPSGTFGAGAYDYMVTAKFVLPFISSIELAALSQEQPLPERPSTLSISSLAKNRAQSLDQPATEAVQLRWNVSSIRQGYAVIVSRGPGQSQVLNAARGLAGGFEPFLPLVPESNNGDAPAGAQTVFIDPVSPLPVSGSLLSRYMVIGIDVFGRWSQWRLGDYSAAALPVVKPGLHSAALIMNAAAAVGHVVPASLEIEFSWDWSDRSPDRIEFTGKFFNASGAPDSSFLGGFRLTETGPIGPAAVIVGFFASGGTFIVPTPGGPSAAIEHLTSDPPDPDRRKYRLTVNGLSCDFTSRSRVAFEVFARGAERLRASELSDPVGPRVALADDPIAPVIPPLPVDLRWTALPDATGRGRGLLTWPASPSAAGYIIWEATEAALRAAVNPSLADEPAGTSLLARATTLRSLVTASQQSQEKSMIAFSRLNTRPISQTRVELELPAGADSIFAYRISAINASNVESARSSDIVMFAVPKRNQPGQPRLVLRNVTTPAPGVLVIAIPGAGAVPDGYRIHKVRRVNLAADVGLMGPPKIQHDDPRWRSLAAGPGDPVLSQFGSLLESLSSIERAQGKALLDTVEPSWLPYFYRIVAVGLENVSAGEYRGESIASISQRIFLTPADPPLLEFVSFDGNKKNRVLRFNTDLPVQLSPLGPAKIEVFQLVNDAVTNRLNRLLVLSIQTQDVPEGRRLRVLQNPSPVELAAMPQITRRAPDAQGLAGYSVRMRGRIGQGIVVATDPLGRSTQLHFSM